MHKIPIGSLWLSKCDHVIGVRVILNVVPAYADDPSVLLITYYDAESDYTASVIATVGDWEYDWRLISP
jgi:hypothetical protein